MPPVKAVLAVAMLVAAILAPLPAAAQGAGDMVVSPTRLVFDDRTRSAEVSLANRGSATATFRISVIDMTMDETGQLEGVEEPPPELKTAGALLRYAPRQIEIPPGQTQVVRIAVRKPADLEPGEYRSHMFFRAIPPADAGRAVDSGIDPGEEELTIQLVPVYGITIPLIVRHGDLNAEVGLEELDLVPASGEQPPRLEAVLTREGDRSTFGDLVARLKPADGGAPVVLGVLSRLAVYTPNDHRLVRMPLQLPSGIDLSDGEIELIYRSAGEEGGDVLASARLNLR